MNGRPHRLGNIASALGDQSSLRDFLGWIGHNFDASTSWRDLEFIRKTWDGQDIDPRLPMTGAKT